MAFFEDNFTDTDGVLLQDHSPDTGDSWTRLWGTVGTNAEINTNRCRSDGDIKVFTKRFRGAGRRWAAYLPDRLMARL
jgi:hypothetical protein